MSDEEQSTARAIKTCPMCAEDVKAAALICRFCGHRFDFAPDSSAAPGEPETPSRPEGPPPDTITANLRPEETVLIWSPCFLNYAAGTVAITTDRVLFTMVDQTPHVNHRLNVDRRVTLGASPTTPGGCRPDGTVVIEFPDERLDLHGMNPDVAREVAATVVPSLVEQLFAEDVQAQQRLREHHGRIAARSAVTAAAAAVTIRACKYMGGIRTLAGSGLRGSLVFSPNTIEVKVWGRTVFTVNQPKAAGVSIEGAEQLQQRLTATRMVGLGVFSLAAPKATRRATSYITLAMDTGETGIFEVKDTAPMALRAQLSPWLAEH